MIGNKYFKNCDVKNESFSETKNCTRIYNSTNDWHMQLKKLPVFISFTQRNFLVDKAPIKGILIECTRILVNPIEYTS